VKSNYDTRVKKEEKKIGKKEKVLMQMEMLEMELIKNLQTTQNVQKTAYTDLEKALMLQTSQAGANPFEGIDIGTPEKKKSTFKIKRVKKRNQSQEPFGEIGEAKLALTQE
jgi:hypothetical protein